MSDTLLFTICTPKKLVLFSKFERERPIFIIKDGSWQEFKMKRYFFSENVVELRSLETNVVKMARVEFLKANGIVWSK